MVEPKHVVGIVGGAVAGSEAAAVCAERGAIAIVFEQNERPYGKIEDGLPRWHTALRERDYARIDANLTLPGVYFVPRTRLGEHLTWPEVAEELGLTALVLANGAWRDRPLPIATIDRYLGRGLAYQNPLVYWFNHYHEAGYAGPVFEVPDGAVVVGGGLASIDVVKILSLEIYAAALRARGLACDPVAMEHAGIPATLAAAGVTAEELDVRGATLLYRRRIEDMPLATDDNPTPERQAKLERARVKIVDKVVRKYLVHVRPLTVAKAPIVEDDHLRGLECVRTEVRDGRLQEVPGSAFALRTDLVVSSIGSIPEPIDGVAMAGELYAFIDRERGVLSQDPLVFGLGNVLTGKGNIVDSRRNAREVMGAVLDALDDRPGLSPDELSLLLARIRTRWDAVGYDGDYEAWMAAHGP